MLGWQSGQCNRLQSDKTSCSSQDPSFLAQENILAKMEKIFKYRISILPKKEKISNTKYMITETKENSETKAVVEIDNL